MQVHWFTVIAQIVNFFVLLVLLQKFLYKPVVQAMQRRQQTIDDALEQAEQQSADATAQAQHYEQARAELEQQRLGLMNDLEIEVQQERQRMMDELRTEVDTHSTQWRADIDREKNSFVTELRSNVGGRVAGIVRRVLTDLADTDLQDQMISHFIHKFSSLPADEKNHLLQGRVIIKTGMALDSNQQQKLQDAVGHQAAAPDITMVFQTDPDLLCGLSLKSASHSLSWSVDSYLDELETNMLSWFNGNATQARTDSLSHAER